MHESEFTLILLAVLAPVIAGVATLILPRRATSGRTILALAGPALSVYLLGSVVTQYGVNEPAVTVAAVEDHEAGHASSSNEEHGVVDTPGTLYDDLTLGSNAGSDYAAPSPAYQDSPDSGVVGIPFMESLHLDLTFNADPLGLFFAFLIAGVGCLIVLYSRGYFGKDADSLFRFYPMLGLFATAMLGLVLADNMIAMLIFWEMTSISSFLLIGWERSNPKAVRLAVQALLVTGMGGIALLGGVLLLGVGVGEWGFSAVLSAFATGDLARPELVPWAFLLMFLGGATKSAQWPFHFWLPGAMAAPTPVSAYLHSATMVKAGIYLFARMYPGLYLLESIIPWGEILIAFGAITMALGALLAIRSAELKKIFAYTTVSQLGLFTCMYGLGSVTYVHDGHAAANIIWPITQILNHALYKAPLFIIAGAIIHTVGKKELHQLKGLLRSHPLLAIICLAGCYAMAAAPFTLSFTAKEAFLYQIFHATETMPWVNVVAVLAALTAIFNMAIFIRFLMTFLATPEVETRIEHDAQGEAHAHDHGDHAHEHERGFWGACLWLPAFLLVAAQYVGGVAPAWFGELVLPFETAPLYWSALPGFFEMKMGAPLITSIIGAVLGILLGLSPFLRSPLEDPHNKLFPAVYSSVQRDGGRIFSMLQPGNFRVYVYLVLSAFVLALGGSIMLDSGLWSFPEAVRIPQGVTGLLMAVSFFSFLVCASALAMPFVRSRIVRVLVLGGVGFSVTGLYLLYQAPDLALTQLMFEIISVILFLLVLRMLPEEPKRWHRIDRVRRGFFAALVGCTVGWVVLQVAGQADLSPDGGALGEWFGAQSYSDTLGEADGRGGGGNNVVNVILVDFRGYDTFGEITVLAIALMGVFALITAAPAKAVKRVVKYDDIPREAYYVPEGAQPGLTTSLFRTSMRVILPLSLIFAGYVFFKGHNEPGGGFIAGLVAATALAVYRMAEGPRALKSLVPIKPGPMAAIGLGIALLTAVVPLVLPGEHRGAFLQSYNGYIPLLGEDPYHWASATFFDIGVLLVVVAVSLGIVNRLTEEME